MKVFLAALVAAFSCLGLVACAIEGVPTTTTSKAPVPAQTQNAATNIYTTVCIGSAGNPPLTATIDTLASSGTLTLNTTQTALYDAIQRDCSYGAPTTVAGVLLWTATLIATVEKQFPQAKIRL